MRCVICDTSAAPHELRDSKCLDCLVKENTTLRLVIAHCIMAIESGETAEHNGLKLYRQQFGEAFLKHLKSVLIAVKSESSPTPQPEQPALPNQSPA